MLVQFNRQCTIFYHSSIVSIIRMLILAIVNLHAKLELPSL